MNSLAELFPPGDFRLHLTLRRGEPSKFFAPQDGTGSQLAERRRWLMDSTDRYARSLPEGEPLVTEFSQLCAAWGLFAANGPSPVHLPTPLQSELVALGSALEPDILLLSPDDEGTFRLRAGVLCFPTGWALEEKLGHTLDFIHGVVPGLNPALGSSISQFLSKLKPGVAFLRDNWGIAASSELNLHPIRSVAPPKLPVKLDELWLRVEHQAIFALPLTGGVVFGIRVAVHRLDHAIAVPGVAAGLSQALATMPDALIAYKRLDGVREPLKTLMDANIPL